MKKTSLVSAISWTLMSAGTAYAANIGILPGDAPITSVSSNFTTITPNGATFAGTNNVVISWDGTAFNASSDYTGLGSTSNIAISSATPFFGYMWTVHDAQVFAPGTYNFDTALNGGNPESGILSMNVGSNQLGAHMLFDWNGNLNIDIAMVWDRHAVFGSGRGYRANPACGATATTLVPYSNCLYDGMVYGPAGKPVGNTVWMLASVDGNGDGAMGNPMVAGGPLASFNFNFNIEPIPLPPAAILFSSGLLSLLGAVRRRKLAQ